MLMLTRRRGEAVDIYDKEGKLAVTVHVAEFLPNNVVRLGFAAADEYTILRDNAKTRAPKEEGPLVTYKAKRRGET